MKKFHFSLFKKRNKQIVQFDFKKIKIKRIGKDIREDGVELLATETEGVDNTHVHLGVKRRKKKKIPRLFFCWGLLFSFDNVINE